MTAIFIAALAVVSLCYFIAAQYIYSGVLTASYAAAAILICLLYFLRERSERRRLIDRVTRIFEGDFDAVCDENELSELERAALLSRKNNAARDAKISESYKNIAALVSDISHQCKTPLSSVLMYSEMPPEAANLAVIHSEGQKLSFLLDALTKLSRCEGGLITENLRVGQNDVSALICKVINDCASSAEKKNIVFVPEVENGLFARFDMRWTAEAVFNIADNAVKYSPEDAEIGIRASSYDMFVRIDISDNGPGIPESEQNGIWKRFYRGKNTGADTEGVGIGLYLTRAILSGEGGRASVKSEAGRGSVFSVYLPKG